MPSVNKALVLSALRERVDAEWALAVAAQKQTVQGVTHEESRPENDKDTRALEASYLARGQAKRVLELAEARQKLERLELSNFADDARVALGALVTVEENDETLEYFIAPAGGGLSVQTEGREVRIVTPESPLGRAFIGRRAGEDTEVRTPGSLRELTIAAVG